MNTNLECACESEPERRQIHLTLTLEEGEGLDHLFRCLGQVGSEIQMDWHMHKPGVVVLEDDLLTECEREALELAIENEQYIERRNLEELAEALDINVSAVSQRIRPAERKITRKYVEALE